MNLILFIVFLIKLTESIDFNQTNLLQLYSTDSIEIHLNNKNITNIDEFTFSQFKSLQIIYLNDNNLKRIANNLFNNLTEIWLESNEIISIDTNIFSGLNSLKLVCLFNNPISVFFPSLVSQLCDLKINCTVKVSQFCFELNTTTTTTSTIINDQLCIITFSFSFNKKIFFNHRI